MITGDIIKSQKTEPVVWLKKLKQALNNWGETPKQWEIFRGDSFQIEIKNPVLALVAAIEIKASMKSVKGVDVRMAIGIGDKNHEAKKITEANGSAFVYSGELLEELKKLKLNLAIRSSYSDFDQEINLYLKLALTIMDNWSVNSAETILAAFQNEDSSQANLGKMLGGLKQNAVSTRLKRARYDEIIELTNMYQTKIDELK